MWTEHRLVSVTKSMKRHSAMRHFSSMLKIWMASSSKLHWCYSAQCTVYSIIGFVADNVHVLHCLHLIRLERERERAVDELVHRAYRCLILPVFSLLQPSISRGFFSDRQTLADWQIAAAVHHRPTTHDAAQRRSRNDQTQGGAPITHPEMQGKWIQVLLHSFFTFR